MQKFVKFLAALLIVATCAGLGSLWFSAVVLGNYLANAGIFLSILALAAPVIIAFLGYQGLRFIWQLDASQIGPRGGWMVLLLVPIAAPMNGCDRASANVQTLITSDCGVSWKLIRPGESIPTRMGMCAYKVTVPDYPMQGETRFKASFKDRVLASVDIAYEYTIVDAKVFIGEAKYIGKANSESDDSTNSAKSYETAENVVIDKRIRDAATGMLLDQDIVEFSQAEFEDKLLEASNEKLKDKGVRLSFIAFVPTPEDQTRLAIDMMTAMRVYESKGLSELGKQVAAARAGATRIVVEAPSSKSEPKE